METNLTLEPKRWLASIGDAAHLNAFAAKQRANDTDYNLEHVFAVSNANFLLTSLAELDPPEDMAPIKAAVKDYEEQSRIAFSILEDKEREQREAELAVALNETISQLSRTWYNKTYPSVPGEAEARLLEALGMTEEEALRLAQEE